MNWSKNFELQEYLFMAAFFLAYGLYFYRLWRLSKLLGRPSRSTILKFLLRIITFILFIFSLLGPIFEEPDKVSKIAGKDIYLAMDLSASMDATDIQPSRLEKIKIELLKILDPLSANKIGIHVFSTEAFQLLPLTYDLTSQKNFIQALNTGMISESGTDIQSVFDLYLQKIYATKETKSRALVIFTDGEDFGQIKKPLAAELKRLKTTVFLVGIGTLGGAVMPNGQTTYVNVEWLKQTAATFGGKMYLIDSYEKTLESLQNDLLQNENIEEDRRNFFVSANKFQYLLAIALALLFIDILWTIRTLRL